MQLIRLLMPLLLFGVVAPRAAAGQDPRVADVRNVVRDILAADTQFRYREPIEPAELRRELRCKGAICTLPETARITTVIEELRFLAPTRVVVRVGFYWPQNTKGEVRVSSRTMTFDQVDGTWRKEAREQVATS